MSSNWDINFDNLLRFWFIPRYIPNILFVPKPSIEPNNDNQLQCNNNDKYIDVFPVYLSPNINYLYPLPTGNILSTILSPVIRESFTLDIKG